jgi:hypothetical protein
LVTLADGSVLRYRSLGGGLFDHRAVTVPMAEDSGAESFASRELLAALVATPSVDFAALQTCASALPMPAKKVSLAVSLATKAETAFVSAAAGTNTKKFAKPAALLNKYIATIDGQVDISIDRAAADVCIVPAQDAVDAILLIGTPASLAADGGDQQTARPFARLPLPLKVKAQDVYGNGTPKVASRLPSLRA